jgi:hypothetical protein
MVKRHTIAARVAGADAGLERTKCLEVQLARAPIHSLEDRALRAAIQIEVGVYRKSLDTEQSRATHDVTPRFTRSRSRFAHRR